MKQNKALSSYIDFKISNLTSKITILEKIPYDEATKQFLSSNTYQLLKDPNTNFYIKEIEELYQIWKQEQQMQQYLNQKIKPSNNEMQEIVTKVIKDNFIKEAIIQNKSIEETLYSNLKPSFKKKKKVF